MRQLIEALRRLLRRLFGTAPDTVFVDSRRGRRIPYRVYEPEGATGPAPVVIFSHGLGGSRDAAPYLGRALAAAGYWGIFLQHPGTDRAILDGAASREAAMERLAAATTRPGAARDRFLDIPFVLDRLEALAAAPDGPFAGRLDMTRVGLAGHSFGARTVLAAAGQRLGGGGPMAGAMGGGMRGSPGGGTRIGGGGMAPPGGISLKDPRVKAGLLLSPSGARRPGSDRQISAEDFAGIDIPLLHVTGTKDGSGPMGELLGPEGAPESGAADLAARTAPFRLIQAPGQYLLVFDGARHSDFSGTSAQRGETPPDPRIPRLVATAAVLFFDAHLKGSPAAARALAQEFPARLAPGDRFELR